jgi:ABC-type phosphate transport system ATPase subunit
MSETKTPVHDATPRGVTETRPDARADTRTVRLEARDVSVHYGKVAGVRSITLPMFDSKVTALIGPSGCGKSTFLRSLNRMHDLTRGARVTGEVLLEGRNIYEPNRDPVEVRRRIGMVFQKPTPFPTMSIYDNVVAGLKLVGIRRRSLLDAGRTLERGQGSPARAGVRPVRWTAAASVHCPGTRGRA